MKRTWLRLGACLLALAILLGAGAWVYLKQGDWLFSVEQSFKKQQPLSWTRLIHTGETVHWTLDTLAANRRVLFNNSLILVNATHPLPQGYEAVLSEYNGARMHPDMIDCYVALRDDVQSKTGIRIYVSSDFRTAEEQAELLATSESGIAASVGCSEHEAGLALDVYAPYYAGESFLKSPAGREVNRICGEYSYIIRYPQGKEHITGISYEPWHLRYVGEPHAKLMMDSGLTLEEYVASMELGEWYRVDGYLIGRCSADKLDLPTGWFSCEISPDNCGNYIVTLKMC